MNKTKHRILISIKKSVQVLAEEEINKKVMEGSEEITEKTDKRRMAEWVKGAMERLYSLVKSFR